MGAMLVNLVCNVHHVSPAYHVLTTHLEKVATNVFQNARNAKTVLNAKVVLNVTAKNAMTNVENASLAFHVSPVLRTQKDRDVTNANDVKLVSLVHHAHPVLLPICWIK